MCAWERLSLLPYYFHFIYSYYNMMQLYHKSLLNIRQTLWLLNIFCIKKNSSHLIHNQLFIESVVTSVWCDFGRAVNKIIILSSSLIFNFYSQVIHFLNLFIWCLRFVFPSFWTHMITSSSITYLLKISKYKFFLISVVN